MKSIIIAFSGKPGSGKTTLSKIVSERLNAVYLRIDTIEEFIRTKCQVKVGTKDYEFSQIIAFDNLSVGNIVISDGCNYSQVTRNGWEEVASKAGCKCLNVEIICSENSVRRKRLAERHYDLSSEIIDEIMVEPFEEWNKEHIIIDTSNKSIDDCADELIATINKEVNWKKLHPKSDKMVGQKQILSYLQKNKRQFFKNFCEFIETKYKRVKAYRVWSNEYGWKWNLKIEGFVFCDIICIQDTFSIAGILIENEKAYEKALEEFEKIYVDKSEDFTNHLNQLNEKRRGKRTENELKKIEYQNEEIEYRSDINKCKWPAKVERAKLIKLYKENANMIFDDDLLDDIGFTIYVRCKEAKVIEKHLREKRIKCTNCGEITDLRKELSSDAFKSSQWRNVVIECKCGQKYTFGGYRKEHLENAMNRGNALPIFDKFIEDWEKHCKSGYEIKIRLIDNLIHEVHVGFSTLYRKLIGCHIIEGTKEEIITLINKLAYE